MFTADLEYKITGMQFIEGKSPGCSQAFLSVERPFGCRFNDCFQASISFLKY
jgi:hypothetical protein